jgi:hypothetical protein
LPRRSRTEAGDGGEGWGEEARFCWLPLSLAVSMQKKTTNENRTTHERPTRGLHEFTRIGWLVTRFITGLGQPLFGDRQGSSEKAFLGLVLFVSIRG